VCCETPQSPRARHRRASRLHRGVSTACNRAVQREDACPKRQQCTNEHKSEKQTKDGNGKNEQPNRKPTQCSASAVAKATEGN